MVDSEICFCKNELIVFCRAKSWEQQKDCMQYEKSYCTDKCMHFILDKYGESFAVQFGEKFISGGDNKEFFFFGVTYIT